MSKDIKKIEISKIFILNPRVRNPESAKALMENIKSVGLKRPIKLIRKTRPKDGKEYDLVCGQGRLEACMALGWTEIPADIDIISQEDALIQSLVENLARRTRSPSEMYREVKRLHDEGYSTADIANKIGVTYEWIFRIIKLIARGEERLINAVEMNKMSLDVAVQIVEALEADVQRGLQEAYDKGLLKGHSLKEIQRLLELRMSQGKTARARRGADRESPKDVHKIIEREMERKRALVIKARKVEDELLFFRESFKKLTGDENFLNLIAAEHIGNVPQIVIDEVEHD